VPVIRHMTPLAVVALLLEIAPPGDALDRYIQSQMAQRQVNALSLAIIQDGQIEARAYGVTARGGAPVTTAALFQAGSIKPVADPNPSFTKTVETAVRAFAQGDAAVRVLQQLTPGARTDLAAGSARAFAGVRGLAYLSAQDVSGRGIERHGGAVSRVLFYRMETNRGRRWLMVHVTIDNLITDYDVVDESE
jgi:hypothetical protein